MSACAIRRWGSGTQCEKPADTPTSKEIEAKLAAIRAERDKQDAMLWGDGAAAGVASAPAGPTAAPPNKAPISYDTRPF
jgi:hypothetical protein